MQVFSIHSLLLVAFAGILVTASPITSPTTSPVPECPSGKPFTGQAGCSSCSTVGNIVCGRDEDRITDLKCTSFGTTLSWVPVDDPGKCGVARRDVPGCPSGKPFTGQAGCSSCSTVGNIVCGRDEDRITDLKCTSFGTTLSWVPVDDPGKCGVARRNVPGCPSGKPFTGQAGCSSCSTVGNIVCGRDEDRITDLKCTSFGTTLSWVPVDDPGKCGVARRDVPECPSGKPFTGQAGCSSCSTVGNIVCGRDEDRVTDLICTAFGTTLSWVPVDDSDKCGVFTPPQQVDGCPSGKPFQETRRACETCATKGNVVCGLDGHMKADLTCTKVNGALIWVAVGGQCGNY